MTGRVCYGSFRDPSGFLFCRDRLLYRQVNKQYGRHYDLLISSGLYEKLTNTGLLIPHEEVSVSPELRASAYKVIKPELVGFVSYPYEWSFSQYKDAALLTLTLQQSALEHDMCLKDASAYNVQFHRGRPVFIDTLSFEKYNEGEPWVAYGQFCRHFMAPLALMSRADVRLSMLMKVYIDGIPLDLASRLLPAKSRFSLAIQSHIHLHAKFQRKFGGGGSSSKGVKIRKKSLLSILDSLKRAVESMKWSPEGTAWADYYNKTNYTEEAQSGKVRLLEEFLDLIRPRTVWDLGANTGLYSLLAGKRKIDTVAFDMDPAAVELNYLEVKKNQETHILPLLMDLTNPSPAIGWANKERICLIERGKADLALALALVHHLAIGNNVPLWGVADFFSRICEHLVVEFVPKSDSQVQTMLASRKDIFEDYSQQGFETAFRSRFTIEESQPISGTDRVLYLLKSRGLTSKPKL